MYMFVYRCQLSQVLEMQVAELQSRVRRDALQLEELQVISPPRTRKQVHEPALQFEELQVTSLHVGGLQVTSPPCTRIQVTSPLGTEKLQFTSVSS